MPGGDADDGRHRDGGGPGAGAPPAGLDAPPAPPRPRPWRAGALAAVLAPAAAAAVHGAAAGAGPALLDATVLEETVEERTAALTRVAVAVTHLGSTAAMAVLALLTGLWLLRRGRRADAVLVVGAMAGAAAVFTAVKTVLDRARPPAAERLVDVANESLPSGHATMSVVVLGSLLVLARSRHGRGTRAWLAAAAAAWVAAVGATRIYLGVHWFSDVVAGWLVGAAWLAVCVAVWSWWHRVDPAPGGCAGPAAPTTPSGSSRQ